MWYLCCVSYKTLDEARKKAMVIGRENFASINKEGIENYVLLYWQWIEKNF